MVFAVENDDQIFVGRQYSSTLRDNNNQDETPIMLRFIQKKPVSATTLCVLILWLTVLVIVAMRTIDLEVERINLSTADIHKLILSMTNVTMSPLLKTNKTSRVHNLQLPPIDLKRQKLLRNWLDQVSNNNDNNINNNNNNNTNKTDNNDGIENNYNNTISNNYDNDNNNNEKDDSNTNNNSNSINNNNITTNETWYDVTNNVTSHKLNVSEQYLTMKRKLKSLLKLEHTLNSQTNETDSEGETQHTNETTITMETNNNKTSLDSHSRKRFSKYFQINPSELENLTLRKNAMWSHHQRKDNSIPNLLQSEIGPISKYNDTIKQNETLHKALQHKFRLPYHEKRSLKRTVFRTGPVISDTTNPEEVRNAIGPVADYDGGDPDPGPDDDDWMFNFGRRYHDDEDG